MGYYVTLQEADFTIPADKLGEAYAAMCALNTTHDHEKTGGSWGPNGKTTKWFAWMDENYPETCPDAKSVLESLGFYTDTRDNGDLVIEGYDSKTGQEELFIKAIFPFVHPDSYLTWRGEDGSMWQHTVTGIKTGRISFD